MSDDRFGAALLGISAAGLLMLAARHDGGVSAVEKRLLRDGYYR